MRDLPWQLRRPLPASPKRSLLRRTRLRLETLEDRSLLSVTPLLGEPPVLETDYIDVGESYLSEEYVSEDYVGIDEIIYDEGVVEITLDDTVVETTEEMFETGEVIDEGEWFTIDGTEENGEYVTYDDFLVPVDFVEGEFDPILADNGEIIEKLPYPEEWTSDVILDDDFVVNPVDPIWIEGEVPVEWTYRKDLFGLPGTPSEGDLDVPLMMYAFGAAGIPGESDVIELPENLEGEVITPEILIVDSAEDVDLAAMSFPPVVTESASPVLTVEVSSTPVDNSSLAIALDAGTPTPAPTVMQDDTEEEAAPIDVATATPTPVREQATIAQEQSSEQSNEDTTEDGLTDEVAIEL
jgi:hypothetical protein